MKVTLEELEGPEAGRRREYEGPCEISIGRGVGEGPRSFRTGEADRTVSRFHCVLEVGLDECRLRDSGSTNGTFVSRSGRFERRLSGPRILRKGDFIRAGSVILALRFEEDGAGRMPKAGRRSSAVSPLPRRCGNCGASLEPLSPRRSGDGLPAPGPDCGFLCHACAESESVAAWKSQGRGTGRRELGEWLLLGRLGQGAMGVVHRAWSARDYRVAAIKEISSGRRDSTRALRLFLREIEAMRALDHPNVVRLLDSGRDEGGHWFVSEYLSGGDLDGLAAAKGGLVEPLRALALARDALLGLEAVHRAGFVHRDVKPSNILLAGTESGTERAKIGDFGLAKRFMGAGDSGITRTGEALGTAYYMAPEQIRDYRKAGPRADLYSMGVTLYRVLAGRFPFGASGAGAAAGAAGGAGPGRMDEYIAAVLESPPLPLEEAAQNLPEGLAPVVTKALEKRPEDRWPSAKAFARELTKLLDRAGKKREGP